LPCSWFRNRRSATSGGDLRDLPLVVEALVWLALFPFVLDTAVWERPWETWLRLLLVFSFALLWSTLFFPRKRPAS
jgi:hypothetical protein